MVISNVEAMRAEKGLSQQAMADRCGMNKVYLGDLLRRKRRLSVRNLEKLAKALDVAPAVLLIPKN